jgi:hypothetical protein
LLTPSCPLLRARQELSYGVYNFPDVKTYFSRLGWTFKRGPSLSYDHFYVKPGKSPHNPQHKRGVDYFLGEAELVAYARKTNIFGEEAVPVQTGRANGKRRARSSSSARTSQATVGVHSGDSGSDGGDQRPRRCRRRSSELKVGSSAQNAIALFSDSSDDSSHDTDNGGVGAAASSAEEEEGTGGGSDEEEEAGDLDLSSASSAEEDLEIAASRRRMPPRGRVQPSADAPAAKRQANGKAKAKKEQQKSPRPLLKTAHSRQRGRTMQVSQRTPSAFKRAPNHVSKRAARPTPHKHKPLAARIGKKAKSAPRRLLGDTGSSRGGASEENGDSGFDLGVAENGESPPRRPPSRVHSRANSVRSSSVSSVMTASPPPNASEGQKQEAPAASASATAHSFLSPSPNATPTAAPAPSRPVPVANEQAESAQVSMELTQVVLPPDLDNKYRIRVSVSAGKPPAHTIWMENLSSHEQRESSFTDVLDLPGASNDVRVPTATVLTALFRCLSSQPEAVVIVGPEPKATAKAKTTFEKGEVELQTATAEKSSSGADGESSPKTLVVAYPALDLFRVEHNFPMKLVSTGRHLQSLAQEVARLREQLVLVQTDRDKLCEQLQQQQEVHERALAQQVEAQVPARLAAQSARPQEHHGEEELERRVAELVERKTQALEQAQEKEKRDRDRARRWVFAQSFWMAAFQPSRALIAGTPTDAETPLLRPEPSTRAYTVEWREVVEIAEPLFQPAATSEGGLTRAIAVLDRGLYQVHTNVSHDSLFQLRLKVSSANSESREIEPTKVLLYDNKRRVSRVDVELELRARDQLSLELQLVESAARPSESPEEWLLTPMPTHNRLLVVLLDEHAVSSGTGSA